jgi:hypothetical protein
MVSASVATKVCEVARHTAPRHPTPTGRSWCRSARVTTPEASNRERHRSADRRSRRNAPDRAICTGWATAIAELIARSGCRQRRTSARRCLG